MPPPIDDYVSRLAPAEKQLLDQVLSCSAIGSPATVRNALTAFIARSGADELMIASSIFDHQARLRSYELVAEIAAGIAPWKKCSAG